VILVLVNEATSSVPVYARPSIRRVLFAAAVVGLLLGVVTTIIHLATDPLADVRAYYDAATRLNTGLPLYVPVADNEVPGSYFYPPLLAIAFRPLALLPYHVAAILWEVIVVASLVWTFWRLGVRPVVLLVGSYLALPIMWMVTIGQAQALITLFLTIGSPWAVALAANIKLIPAVVAVYWVGRREWNRLAMFAVWMVGLLAFQFILEPSGTLAYVGFLTATPHGAVNLSPYAISPILWVVTVVVLTILALKLAPTRWGWAAAVVLSVFGAPRLLSYQLSTLLATMGGPDAPRRAIPWRRVTPPLQDERLDQQGMAGQ
jgi:hypothetical protein